MEVGGAYKSRVLYLLIYSIWDVEQGIKLCTHSNNNSHSRITAAEFINPHDISFLLTGTGKLLVI